MNKVRITIAGKNIVMALLAAVFWSGGANADTLSANASDQQDKLWYDEGHDYVTERLQRTAVWFDSFFGDPRVDGQTDASAYLHVLFDNFYSGVEDQSEYGIRFRGGADLPLFDEKLRLMITSDADASMTGRELAGTAQDDVEDTDGAVGLSYLFRDRPNHKFSFNGGLTGGLSPELLLAGRYTYTKPWTANTVSHVVSTLYWRSDDGAGLSTLLDYEWSWDEYNLWRYTLFGNYKEEQGGVEWSAQAKWSRRLNAMSAINVRGGIEGETEPDNVLTEGWLQCLYRRNFLRSWLFYEVGPGLSWHQLAEYQTEPTITLRLEVQFHKE